MAKFRVKEVKKNNTSRFYPQTKIWGVWFGFTTKENAFGRKKDLWFLTKKKAWDAIEVYKRQNSPEEVIYHHE